MNSNYLCYPFMAQKTIMTDFEIMTDKLSSELGLCACIADSSLAIHISHLAKNVYELNGSIRGHNTITQMMIDELEHEYLDYKSKLNDTFIFVLPQGTLLACQLHIARCTAKQVVRIISIINRDEKQVDLTVINYAHLLANHLSILSKYVNQMANISEVPFISKNYAIK